MNILSMITAGFWGLVSVLLWFNVIDANKWLADLNNTQRLATLLAFIFFQTSYLFWIKEDK